MPRGKPTKKWIQVTAVLTSLVMIIFASTMFFHLVEGWSLIDSYFFSVITLSTVGYGDLSPATTLGKIGATVFIFIGIGVFAYAIRVITIIAVERQERKLARKHNFDEDDLDDHYFHP